MKDVTNTVIGVFFLIFGTVAYFGFDKTEPDAPQTETRKYYPSVIQPKKERVKKVATNTVTQKSEAKKVVMCQNSTAVHEAAHYVIYMMLMQQNGLEPKPRKLTIIPTAKFLGAFHHAILIDDWIEIQVSLAGLVAEKELLSKDIDWQRNSTDMRNAVRLCKRNRIDVDNAISAVAELVQKHWYSINEMALRLEKEKEIVF